MKKIGSPQKTGLRWDALRRPHRRQHRVIRRLLLCRLRTALATIRHGLTVQDFAVGIFSVSDSRPWCTSLDGTCEASPASHLTVRTVGRIQHAILDCVTRAGEAYCTSMRQLYQCRSRRHGCHAARLDSLAILRHTHESAWAGAAAGANVVVTSARETCRVANQEKSLVDLHAKPHPEHPRTQRSRSLKPFASPSRGQTVESPSHILLSSAVSARSEVKSQAAKYPTGRPDISGRRLLQDRVFPQPKHANRKAIREVKNAQ